MPGVSARNKEIYWEIIAPEPFIIDSDISDEQFITEMISVSKTSQISDLIHSHFQKPTKSFVVCCSEKELKKLLSVTSNTFKSKIEKQKNGWLFFILDENNEFIGRGEVIKLGEMIPKDKFDIILESHMQIFMNKYETGTRRIKSLMFKMESIKNKITSGGKILS